MSQVDNTFVQNDDAPPSMPLTQELSLLFIVAVIAIPVQLIAVDINFIEAVFGLFLLILMCIIGVLIGRYVPVRIPSVAWISLIGIAATLPFTPWGPFFIEHVEKLDFLALTVPCLAYAGLAISQIEIDILKKSGWKLVIVAVLVIFGTYISSAVIAHFELNI